MRYVVNVRRFGKRSGGVFGEAIKVRVQIERKDTMPEIMEQLKKNCGSRLAMVHDYYKNRNDEYSYQGFLENCLSYGRARLSPLQRRLVGDPVVPDSAVEYDPRLPF